VESIFGLSHLGYAGLPHSTYFGTDIYKRQCGPSPPQIVGGRAGIGGTPRRGKVRLSIGWTYSAAVKPGVHHLRLVDVRGLVALEGLAIASRTG
jgi:hypothetical protein